MTAEANVKTRCPICSAKYRVPVTAVGHRAQCGQCKATFRVGKVESSRRRPPTEEDILAWLSEGRDDDLFDHEDTPGDRRRSLEKRPPAKPGTPSGTAKPPPAESSALHQKNRLPCIEAEPDAKILQFRKTG